jgi:uncharacterized protein (DUF952 family)
MILHIISKSAWADAQQSGEYRGDTLATEGFIHCSTSEQVVEVANLRFRGRTDLCLLVIDPTEVKPKVIYEDGGNGKLYPHMYGPLNLSAVKSVVAFTPLADGSFMLPSELIEKTSL